MTTERDAVILSRAAEAAQDLKWRFPKKIDQIAVVVWYASSYLDPLGSGGATAMKDRHVFIKGLMEELKSKYITLKGPRGEAEHLVPTTFPDNAEFSNEHKQYFVKDGAGNITYLGMGN